MHHTSITGRLSGPARLPFVLSLAVLTLGIGGCANLQLGGGAAQNPRGGYGAGSKVVVLLPETGPYAGVAEAVRDGVRAAAGVDDTGAVPTLTNLDSGDSGSIPAIHAQALESGATQVIGPLEKPAVDALAEGAALKVPTLALNEGTFAGRPATNLYQFSLSPEADAIEVANKAKAQGLTRALMLFPEDAAGQRRADAFRRQWRTLGGTLVGESAFGDATDAETVNGLLGQGQADVLFLAVNADQARAIYPQIRDASPGLPVIATSDVYSGDSHGARDRALAGLYFVDMPWMLGLAPKDEPLKRADLKSGAAHLASPLGRRLYAMGIDAYRLAPRLTALAANPKATMAGQTGRLSVDSMGRVRRGLILARFTEKGPQPVEALASDPPAKVGVAPKARPEPAPRG